MKESSWEVTGIIQTRQNGGLGQSGNNGYVLKAKSIGFLMDWTWTQVYNSSFSLIITKPQPRPFSSFLDGWETGSCSSRPQCSHLFSFYKPQQDSCSEHSPIIASLAPRESLSRAQTCSKSLHQAHLLACLHLPQDLIHPPSLLLGSPSTLPSPLQLP